MDDFIEVQGSAFISHRLRRSSDRILDQIGGMLADIGLDVPPRGASMLLLLDEERAIGVVEIARRLRLSHPLIVRMVREFEKRGLLVAEVDPADARRRRLVPTAKADREAAALRAFLARVGGAVDALLVEIDCPLLAALDRLDAALTARPLADRIIMEDPT